MLQIPQIGFSHSASQSNVDIIPLGDWLEGIILFDQTEVSRSDVVDILIEEQICPDKAQDLAHEIASDGWGELYKRKAWGGIPDSTIISINRIKEDLDWKEQPIRAFFLLLSLFRLFPDWAKANRDYVTQGNLFEKVVELICPAIFPEWEVYRVGWSPTNAQDIPKIVEDLCKRLNVNGATNLGDWHDPNEKDGGLDIVCYRPFADKREAMPTYFLQCASGKNWRDKIMTPNPKKWHKLLDSALLPSTGIVAPFVISSRELKTAALEGQVTVFDRLRLLSSVIDKNIKLPDDLSDKLIKWMSSRIDVMPRA